MLKDKATADACDAAYPVGSLVEEPDDPAMPGLVHVERNEFELLAAQNACARRAMYGVNGAAPGVEVSVDSGSRPVKSESELAKAVGSTKYMKSRGKPSKAVETRTHNT